MSAIWLTIREFLTSKKFIVAVAGLIVAAAGKVGLELPTDTVVLLLAPIITYLISQGWADRGKEAAKVAGTVALVTSPEAPTGDATQDDDLPRAVKDKLI